jgi:hypothetical protein
MGRKDTASEEGQEMRPATLSASAITAFENCPAHFKARQFDRVASYGNQDPANLGKAVHSALETFVYDAYIVRHYSPDLKVLLEHYQTEFERLFGHSESEMYHDGARMLEEWYTSNPFRNVEEVISVEVKNQFEVPTPLGPLPVNYIFDRLDLMVTEPGAPRHYRVVDYKSQRWGYNADAIRKMIQARIYALAVQLQYGREEAITIEVEMDLLRHNRVSAFFTEKDNRDTWMKLIEIIKAIYKEDEDNPTRRICELCRYCPIAATCPELLTNKAQGGFQVVGTDLDIATKMIYEIDNQMKGLESLRVQTEKVLLDYAENENIIAWEDDGFDVKATASVRRSVDSERLGRIIGPDLVAKYGKIGVTALDTMIKNGELTEAQAVAAKELIGRKHGQPTIKVTRKTPFEEM